MTSCSPSFSKRNKNCWPHDIPLSVQTLGILYEGLGSVQSYQTPGNLDWESKEPSGICFPLHIQPQLLKEHKDMQAQASPSHKWAVCGYRVMESQLKNTMHTVSLAKVQDKWYVSFSCAHTMKYLSTAAIGKYKPQTLSLTQDTAHNMAEDKLVSTCQQVGFASIFIIRK